MTDRYSSLGGAPSPAVVLVAILAMATASGPVVAQEPLGQAAGWALGDDQPLIPIAGGSELLLAPDPAARVLEVLPEARLPLLESSGRWVKVRYGEQIGWVDLEGGRAPGEAPPVKVVVAEPEAQPLGLGDDWPESELGPYKLFSKVEDAALIDDLRRVAGEHARVYAERYGLPVDAELAGSVVLFAGRRAFLEYQRSHGHGEAEGRLQAYFHSPETIFMYRGRGSRTLLAATLIHELTHLVNWRTLRDGGRRPAAMPPWLEEGMAEDLTLSRLARRAGRLEVEPLTSSNLRYGQRLGAVMIRLEQGIGLDGTAPSLPRLLAMDKDAFLATSGEIHYLMSALWLRYLLSGTEPGLADGFRAFLASVAGGGDPDAEVLRAHLGASWESLAGGFRGWLREQRTRIGL